MRVIVFSGEPVIRDLARYESLKAQIEALDRSQPDDASSERKRSSRSELMTSLGGLVSYRQLRDLQKIEGSADRPGIEIASAGPCFPAMNDVCEPVPEGVLA